jgi:membrane-associated phospholipid phosphatase
MALMGLNMIMKKTLLLGASLLFCTTLSANKDSVKLAGDILYALIPLGSYASTFYMDDSEGRMEFYKSLGLAAGVSYGLKYLIDAPRPDGSDNNSFPSGHTTLTFASAVFLHKRYGWKSALPAYIGASFVGFSRVYSNEHYTRDVLAGAAIGAVSSWFFTDRFVHLNVNAYLENNYKILQFNYTF